LVTKKKRKGEKFARGGHSKGKGGFRQGPRFYYVLKLCRNKRKKGKASALCVQKLRQVVLWGKKEGEKIPHERDRPD